MAISHHIPMGFTEGIYAPGIHMCYIYNDENERNSIIYRFLESGLLHGENVFYFMDTYTVEEMLERKTALGIDRLYERKDGRFSFATAREAYCPTGVFDPDKMLEKLVEFYEQSVNEGYTGARATGEMSWATKGVQGSSRLMEYEARLNTKLMKCPITGICQYDAKRFGNKPLRDVLAVHPMIIFHGQIIKNPYYIKSWWLLKRFLDPHEG